MARAEDDNDKVWNLAEKIGFCMHYAVRHRVEGAADIGLRGAH